MFNFSSANAFNLVTSKILSFPKGITLSKTTNSDSSKLKEFADNNFKFDENGGKFSRRIENTVEKGEIACYEQFLSSQCFHKTYPADT